MRAKLPKCKAQKGRPNARARRDLVILASRRAGIPARWVAEALAVSHSTVLEAENRAETALRPRAEFLSECDYET